MYKDFSVIILAGGSSTRYGGNKLLEELAGYPVIFYSLNVFLDVVPATNIILVINEQFKEELLTSLSNFISQETIKKIRIVSGGASRQESVLNGLIEAEKHCKPNTIAIHDGARPLVNKELISNLYDKLKEYDFVIPGKKVTDTLKEVTPKLDIIKTVDREKLIAVETPQMFDFKKLLRAYNEVNPESRFTDDASLMEQKGYLGVIYENPKQNTKVTYTSDIDYLTWILNNTES
jgi:2-C-methyl-D-erythritol 4-phosphate cytidylyltransferase